MGRIDAYVCGQKELSAIGNLPGASHVGGRVLEFQNWTATPVSGSI